MGKGSTAKLFIECRSALDTRDRRRLYNAVCDYFDRAPRLLALVDYLFLAKAMQNWFGGPLNGQRHRQLMVNEIVAKVNPVQIVETGTFRGVTTLYFAGLTNVPINTVESNRQYYLFSKWSLRAHSNIKVHCAHSVTYWKEFARQSAMEKGPIVFYLDAHWYDNLPLKEELEIIFKAFTNVVVLIDDFQVPSDPGYTFDDYGPDKQLTLSYLRPIRNCDYSIFFPSVTSDSETGSKRGSVVLCKGSLVESVLHSFGTIRCFAKSNTIE